MAFVDNLSVWPDEHREGYRGIPIRIERGEQRIDVGRPENQVPAGRVQFVQDTQNARLFVRIINAYGHHIEGSVAVHAIDCLKLGHFCPAWTAPRGPEIH